MTLLRDDRDADYQAKLAAYNALLARKMVAAPRRGLKSIPALEGHLKGHQAAAVAFDLEAGSAGTYFATGLGKTPIGLSYARHVCEAINKPALILTPLAVARQWEREGQRWGYDIGVIREQADARHDLNVCNLDRLDKLDPAAFGPIVLDESACLKAFTGKRTRQIIEAFSGHAWRLGLSAAPAPNDHTELAQQAEFLGIMRRDEMLVRWFINDSGDTKTWRLKGHAENAFFDWMASWCRMAEHPRDLGFDEPGYDLPPLNIIRHRVDDGHEFELGGEQKISATTMHDIKRQTAEARAALTAEVVGCEADQPWILWVDTDAEADAVSAVIPDAVEVRGSHSIDYKEETLAAFSEGQIRILLTKGSIAGWGLNWQHCGRQVFVGRSFSYELYHQMIRRSWRFGRVDPVDAHLIVAEGEDQIGRVVDHKAGEHVRLMRAMAAAMRRSSAQQATLMRLYNPTCRGHLPAWLGRTS